MGFFFAPTCSDPPWIFFCVWGISIRVTVPSFNEFHWGLGVAHFKWNNTTLHKSAPFLVYPCRCAVSKHCLIVFSNNHFLVKSTLTKFLLVSKMKHKILNFTSTCKRWWTAQRKKWELCLVVMNVTLWQRAQSQNKLKHIRHLCRANFQSVSVE